MNNPTYVIRSYQFGYNDECYYVCGARINSVYDDKAEAEAKYRALEIAHGRHSEIDEQASVFDGGRDFLAKLDQFVFDSCGEHILDGNYVERGTSLPAAMSDDQVLKFVKMADMEGYKLVAFDNDPVFFALWDCEEESYQMDYDECYEGLVYAESHQRALKNLAKYVKEQDWDSLKLSGTVEELSLTPAVLQELIATNDKLAFDADKKVLTGKRLDPKTLAAVNELLRQPLFELRQLSLAQIQELESELGEEY